MALTPVNTCPACKAQRTVEAPPVTRTTRAGRKQVVAHRRKCEDCGYTDRVQMFRGVLSLNSMPTSSPRKDGGYDDENERVHLETWIPPEKEV